MLLRNSMFCLALSTHAVLAQEVPMPQPFTIDISAETIADLQDRLRATRLPAPIVGAGFGYGMDYAYLQELITYWAEDYDWQAEQARLNTLDQFTVEIDGITVHFVHVRSPREDAIPLMLLHGWPSSFVQMADIIPLLTDPEDGPAFHVVVPSLIGYGFSEVPAEPGMSAPAMAPIFHRLMTEVLGYDRYGVRSSDLGAAIGGVLSATHHEAVIGHHTGGTNPFLPPQLPDDLTEEEQAFVQAAQVWDATEMAYLRLQATKPDTLGTALNDSPAGLAAWIGEKFWRWTDNDGRIEDAIDRDAFLTNLTIYWATETVTPSMRLYLETFRDPVWAMPQVPVGYLMPENDFFPTPRSWIERQGPVGHWTETDKGGHFMEWEEPEIVANDLRQFFGALAE
jgi:pimeloyl-ACP methyl ester carboxylesterase